YGEDDEKLYWSETTSEASSYGNEAELRKAIRDSANEEWTQNLRVEVEDGKLVDDEYVYNLEFIPHGNYHDVTIVPAVDELPVEVAIVSYVYHHEVDSKVNAEVGLVDIGGNLEAIYDVDIDTVTGQTQAGKLLVQEGNISADE